MSSTVFDCDIRTTLAELSVAEQALREEPYERLPALAGMLAIAAMRIEQLNQTSLVGVEKPEDNPYQKPRGVWIEFADDGKRVVDILHEPKDADMPDSYVWCEESR